jgi:ATP-dependent Lhr-like helicase
VKFVKGKKIGTIEEYFLAQLAPGDTFWFAGQALELVRIKEMQAQVTKSTHKNGRIPSYMGGRMPLSTEMSKVLRKKLDEFEQGNYHDPEIKALVPLFELQQERSILPSKDRFVVEYFETSEGFHLVMYPFEGRQVHEGIGALIGQRLAEIQPMSISIAMNDYGLELLSDTEIDVEAILTPDLFSTKNLELDIQASINAVEMSRRRFRDIAKISGLIFQGFPGREKRERHLQSSSSLLFDVFREYEPDNLLYLQTYDEVMTFQLEEARMRNALNRIQNQEIILVRPEKVSPFAFPLIVDMLNRERISSETLEDRIEKMKVQLVN